MDCANFRKEFLDGAGEAADADEHLAMCGQCQAFKAEVEAAWAMLDHWSEIDPPRDFKSRFWAKARRSARPPLRERMALALESLSALGRNWLSAAAMLLLVLLAIGLFSWPRRPVTYTEADKRDEQLLLEINRLVSEQPDFLFAFDEWSGPREEEPKGEGQGKSSKGV